jgi:methylated-DNA-[protein]-cysteine S-methyltransferase
MIEIADVASPIGVVRIAVRDGVVRAVGLRDRWDEIERRLGDAGVVGSADPAGAVTALRAYFEGDVEALDAVPVETGGTRFQRKCWDAMRAIPVGSTASYGDLAVRVGVPAASRAVGAACARNPVWIIVPCHRVLAAGGGLGGYGGGLDRKRWLLAHERHHVSGSPVAAMATTSLPETS